MRPRRRALTLGVLALLAATSVGSQPTDLEGLYQAGAQAFQAGRPYEALELLGAVANRNPGYRDVQLLLGQSCLVVGLLVPAKRHFEQALEADPGNGLAAFLLGFTLYQSARYFEADRALARAHQMAPANPNPLIYRGLSRLRLGRAEEARTDISNALAQAPQDATARSAMAELELAAGRYQAAETLAREVAADSPAAPDPKLLLGRVLLEAGRPAEAIPVFRQVLEMVPNRSDALYLLAQSLLRSGHTEEGRQSLARFQELKTLEEEIRVLQVAVKTDPDDVASRLELARKLLGHGQSGEALMHLAVLRKLRPDDPEVQKLADEAERRRRGPG